jgi:hypothetical protein
MTNSSSNAWMIFFDCKLGDIAKGNFGTLRVNAHASFQHRQNPKSIIKYRVVELGINCTRFIFISQKFMVVADRDYAKFNFKVIHFVNLYYQDNYHNSQSKIIGI